jgi:hypothetical protein
VDTQGVTIPTMSIHLSLQHGACWASHRWTVSSPYFDLSRPQSFREKNEMTTYLIDAQRIPFSS